MKTKFNKTPRKFMVGKHGAIELSDMGSINLAPNQQLTFLTDRNREYDVVRKSWGFYATPSINVRLKKFGFKTALVRNTKGQIYVMLVEEDKMEDFFSYLEKDENYLIEWLDERQM